MSVVEGGGGGGGVGGGVGGDGFYVMGAAGDVSKAGADEKMVGDTIEALGRLDFLANNAGTSATVAPIPPAELDRVTEEFWATILATNLLGPFRCTRAAATALRAARGAGCNTASVPGRTMAGRPVGRGERAGVAYSPSRRLGRGPWPRGGGRMRGRGYSSPRGGRGGGGPRESKPPWGARCSGAPARPPISPPRSYFCAPTP